MSAKACRKLSGQEQTGCEAISRILCIGYDQHLLSNRAVVLRKCGFDVATASTLEEARTQLAGSQFAAIVIGHRVPVDRRNQIVSQARRTSARITVVLLYREAIRDAACANAVLSVDSGPRFLANSLRYLLIEDGRSG